jgi:hypothetical protein
VSYDYAFLGKKEVNEDGKGDSEVTRLLVGKRTPSRR